MTFENILLFVGRTTRKTVLNLSFKAITAIILGTSIIGRLLCANKDIIVEILYLLIPSMPHRGNLDY